jgi:drug/metabolite transporter (DMT)-like permease
MKNLFLYFLPVAIWGSTWYAITFQLNTVSTSVSIAYRFGLAAFLLFGWCSFRRLRLSYSWREHRHLLLLGLTLFSTNYVLFYEAEKHLVSGGVAIIFSVLVVFNILNNWLFLGQKPDRAVLAGAAFGLLGIVLTFWPDLQGLSSGSQSSLGIALSLAGAYVASLGNLIAMQLQKHRISVFSANAFGMLYGTLAVSIWGVFSGVAWRFDPSAGYLFSLLYLALFGSVIAFGAYLTLLGRIGPDRAAYSSILIPVVALLLSAIFEHYRLTLLSAFGIACILAGNALVLARKFRSRATPALSRPVLND